MDSAASSWAVENPLDVAKRLVGDVEQASQIIAFALLFPRGGNFWVIVARTNQAACPFEVLLARVL
jgi:hypothetical protein